MLGMLFGGIFFGVLAYTLLMLSFRVAAEAMGMVGGLLVCVWAARWLWQICFGKPARTPVGPLSADDRVKARAKLLRRN